MYQPKLILILLMYLCSTNALQAAELNWPSWRGPDSTGSIAGGKFPRNWSTDNVAWKTPLPGKGCSSPIIWNRQIFVTSPVDGNDAVMAFDAGGNILWKTTFGKENPGRHRNGSGSNPSPVTDGEAVFANFKSGTLAALNLAGDVLWKTNLVERFGPDTLFWDHGSSPVVTNKSVIVARMHHGESWLAAFDKSTGDLQWKVPRNYQTPTEGDHGYSTPVVVDFDNEQALLVWGAEHLTIHRANDGHIVWSCGDFNPEQNKLWPSIASPVIAEDMAVIAFGRNDRGYPRLHGIRLTGSGDVTSANRIWMRDDISTFVPSPVQYKGNVYLVRDRGEVECIDPKTGATRWSDAFPKNRSAFYSSPLIAGGNLYAAREDGVVFVANIESKFKLLAEIDMQEPIIASPVPFGNRILLRGYEHLFCVGK